MPVVAESPVKIKQFDGTVEFAADGSAEFTLAGRASHLGDYTCSGEVQFVPGEDEGSLIGQGVAVFRAANGDQLVANVTWEVEPGGDFRSSKIHFHWADSVEFADGSIFASTGRFVDSRPPGLVVIAIVSVLLGLLYPGFPR